MQIYKITKGNFALEKTRDIRPHENNLRFHIKIRTPNAVFNKVLKHKRGFLNKYAYVVKLDNLSLVIPDQCKLKETMASISGTGRIRLAEENR